MKKLLLIIAVAFGLFASSCIHKGLCDLDHQIPTGMLVVFHWDANELPTVPVAGMRTNFFSLTPSVQNEIIDLPDPYQDSVWLVREAEYLGLCYDYNTHQPVFFRREDNSTQIEAIAATLVRASYTKSAYPRVDVERTYAEPPYPFYVGTLGQDPNNYPMPQFVVPSPGTAGVFTIDFYPRNVVKMYTFRINGVHGAQHISDTRGGISGMSSSYFLGTNQLAASPSTVFFNASTIAAEEAIVGRFATFGPLDVNWFTIEIKYPIEKMTTGNWNVTDQVTAALCLNDMTNPDIIINADITIIPETKTEGTFDPRVEDWDGIIVPMNAPRNQMPAVKRTYCPKCGAPLKP